MEWSRAKKYTIIMLVLLNIVLFTLNVYKSFETRLGSGRINAVTSLLEEKNITLAAPLPRSYKPMADISVSEFVFDYIRLQKIFMEGESNVKRTDEYNSVVFMSDNSRLSVKGGAVTFTSGGAGEIKSSEEARAYAEGVIERINEYFGNYKFHSMYSTDEGWSVKFYEKNEGYSVFSNFAYFTIKGSNIALSLNYMKTGSELNVKNDIYAADEALYSAVPLIEKEKGRTNVSDVELGYYAVKSGTEEIATPFYLIVSEGKEYYVNAYTGECF